MRTFFENDADMQELFRDRNQYFEELFKMAFKNYIGGYWFEANNLF